jgi:hypothetical protein
MQTGPITGRGQIVGTKTNPALGLEITVGGSIVEMKLSIAIGSEPGKIQCSDPEQALSVRREDNRGEDDWDTQSNNPGQISSKITKRAHSDEHSRSIKSNINQPDIDAISLRQRALEVIVSVTPANIGSLIDPFRYLNNNPGGLSGMGGGRSNGGSSASSSKTVPTSGSSMALGNSDPYRLKDIVNANTLTAVVIGAVTAAVGNTVAASSASSSASMSNAFQMIGHAQCEYSFVRESIFMLHCLVIRTCAGE